ncbi:MAG: nitrate- and nitrite sensing domain-containing protein [Bacteroidota bacterium]
MAGIRWSDDLAIGAPAVDAQHRALVELLAEAGATFDGGDVRAAVRLLRRFLNDFGSHFASEQSILAQAECDATTTREREYKTSQFIFAAHPLEADDVEVIGQLLSTASAWLIDHIVRQDAPLKPLLSETPAAGRHGRRRLSFDMLKLRWRIALLALVPLCAMAALVIISGIELQRNASSMRLMARMNQLNAHIATVIHELQRERGLATLVLHDRRLGRDHLDEQFIATDRAADLLRATARAVEADMPPGDMRERLDGALLSLDLITEVRDDLTNGSYDAVETQDFYTTAIEDLAGVVPDVVRAFLPSDFTKLTFAQIFLQQAKERAGQERTAGVAILSSAAPEHSLASVRDLAAEQRALGDGFAALAPTDLANAYRAAERKSEGPLAWMRAALESGDLIQLSAQEWFDISSQHIDDLRAVETEVTARLKAEAESLDRRTNQRFLMLGGGMAVLVLASLAMVLSLGWSILPPLARLAAAVRRLADGERAVAIPGLAARDELGAVAGFVQQLKERLVHSDLLEARRLTTNAERLRVVADNTPGIVFRFFQAESGRTAMVCASRKLKDIVGLSPADVVDLPVRRLMRLLVQPADWAALLRMLRRSEPSSLSFEFQLRREQPGAPRWLRVVVSPSPTEGGWLWDGVALDVTALRAAERQRGQVTTQLARIGGLAAAPRSTTAVARELAAALHPLHLHAERAEQSVPADSPARAEVAAILASTRRLEALVNGLLGDDTPQRGGASASNVIPLKGKP